MFQTNRWFNCGPTGHTNMYTVPIAPSFYDVRLYFAETFVGTSKNGSRVYDVFLNGQRVITSFDVIAAAGQTLTAYTFVSALQH